MKKVMLLLSLFCFVGSISAGRSAGRHSPILQELVHKQLERQFEKRQSDQRLMAQQQIALENAENEQSDEAPTLTGILCSDCIVLLVPHNPEKFAELTYDEKMDELSRIKAAHDALHH